MSQITYFTPPGAPVWASLKEFGGIQFPDISEWVPVDLGVARRGELKPANFMELVEKYKAGEKVNLAEGGQIRIGCSFALKVFLGNEPADGGRYVFSKYSETHPTQGNKITPPGGVYDRIEISPRALACDELSEEIIFAYQSHDLVRCPSFHNSAHLKHIHAFCGNNGFSLDPLNFFPVTIVTKEKTNQVTFGKNLIYQVGVTFEPVGSVELIWFGEARLKDHKEYKGVRYFDGELFPDGTARNSKVVSDNYLDYPLTEKAELVLAIG